LASETNILRPQTAESLHGWLARHLPSGPHPPIKRPFNWLNFIAITTAILGIVTLGTVAYPYVMPVIQNRNIWAGISLIAVLLFTSGHMFNHIRKVPYVSSDGHGGISYFAGGFQNQFGLETQIVAAIYGILAFATITLALKVPRIKDERTQQVAALAWAAVTFVMYSFLLSVFRFKNGGYPFWLPPF
jgi:oligosaccharyltransferase complex subunit gamma